MPKKRNANNLLDGINSQNTTSSNKIMTTVKADNVAQKKTNRRGNVNKSKKPKADTPTKSNIANDKQQQADATKDFRNVSFKESAGCNNWKRFLEAEATKKKTGSVCMVEVEKNNVDSKLTFLSHRKKLPLMKQTSNSICNNIKGNFWSKGDKVSKRAKVTTCVAMDCEMVGIGESGSTSIIARVSIVNCYGQCIYDKFVKPTETVTDYRTFVSGIRPSDLEKADDFHVVQTEVANILKGRTLIGHSLKNDLGVLMLTHPKRHTRDTMKFLKFRGNKGAMSLKALAEKFINVKIQDGEHSSVEDARAAMQLYMTYRKELENERREMFSKVRANLPLKKVVTTPKESLAAVGFSEIANNV